MTLKQRFWKIAKWFGALFFLMLVCRLIYGYIATDVVSAMQHSGDFFSSVDNLRKNYASENKVSRTDVGQQASFASSQKYEKTATVKSRTSQFEKDANEIKDKTKDFKGVIQYEQNTGNKGNREVHLMIGINPEKFDSFYLNIQGIGKINSTEITKIDKTNEYRQLNAKKASLEKTLLSLNELRSRGGVISDYVSLHDKILEIETRLQELGVELGNFDVENEFCTIRFSLFEGAPQKGISFLSRLKVALEWTIQYYSILAVSLLCLTATIFILILIIDKLKIISTLTKSS
ncbi:DUF4349 domain-containing protein [Chitinophaga sp. SYP-B3965]|uniref:DUF4349 domain-containing protein n=1 Tax=Chitinophaga sp. SYP-B3965 TaxID=2663120 RepID=UPI00129999C5|nr:DUF4349 domain-containing protein [Chitinophaga sp. SYP-B3965]MRG47856.1 DUF4349 domain-containing protein [Chitinophaga sp. SYP-B3965]